MYNNSTVQFTVYLHSTFTYIQRTHQHIILMTQIAKHIISYQYTAVFLGLSKAFDTISHNKNEYPS